MVGVLIGTSLVALVFLGLYLTAIKDVNKIEDAVKTMVLKHQEEIIQARQDAITSTRNTLRGQISEEVLPLFPDFPYILSDCKFSGAPIDYLVFKNMSAIRDGDKSQQLEIIIAEVKTNKARTSTVQKAIKDAVDNGRVKFETWRIKDNQLIIK